MTRLVDILEIVHGKIICVSNGKRKVFVSDEDLLNSGLYKNHIVTSIYSENNSIILELQPYQITVTDIDPDWAKKYKEQNGFEPSFF